MGHAEGLSQASQRDFAPFPMPLHRGIVWEGVYGLILLWTGSKNARRKEHKGPHHIKKILWALLAGLSIFPLGLPFRTFSLSDNSGCARYLRKINRLKPYRSVSFWWIISLCKYFKVEFNGPAICHFLTIIPVSGNLEQISNMTQYTIRTSALTFFINLEHNNVPFLQIGRLWLVVEYSQRNVMHVGLSLTVFSRLRIQQ